MSLTAPAKPVTGLKDQTPVVPMLMVPLPSMTRLEPAAVQSVPLIEYSVMLNESESMSVSFVFTLPRRTVFWPPVEASLAIVVASLTDRTVMVKVELAVWSPWSAVVKEMTRSPFQLAPGV